MKNTFIGASGLTISHEDLIKNIEGCSIVFDPLTCDYVLTVQGFDFEDFTSHHDTRDLAEFMFLVAVYGPEVPEDMFVHYYPNMDAIESVYMVHMSR